MPRPAKTPQQRAADVTAAAAKLSDLTAAAVAAMAHHGPDSPAARAAWDAVEVEGATVHRQARLLAGKSRGG